MSPFSRPLIIDANVLIDFLKTRRQVLKILCKMGEAVYVPDVTIMEIDENLSVEDALSLGLKVCETGLDVLYEARGIQNGISFQDNVCLLMAKKNNWTCVTNDARLRRECGKQKVEVLWGFNVLLHLAKKGRLNRQEAIDIALEIQKVNNRITETIMKDFIKTLPKA